MDIVVCISLFLWGIFSAGSPSPKKNTWETSAVSCGHGAASVTSSPAEETSGEPARKFYYPVKGGK
jgi:hypothetical protein